MVLLMQENRSFDHYFGTLAGVRGFGEAFTICGACHCAMLGPTWPNRMFWMTGTIDPDGLAGGPLLGNRKIPGGFHWTTYAERLEKAGISWKAYQQKDNFGTNVLAYFWNFMEAARGSPLHERGMVRGPEGQFEQDAANDRLPAVSWIFPPSHQSERPDVMPAEGAAFSASKIDAIAANPRVWAKTVFILCYDENISAWRRRTFGDLTSAFRFDDRMAGPPRLPDATDLVRAAADEVARLPLPMLPDTPQSMPVQARGRRRTRAAARGADAAGAAPTAERRWPA
ncbi:MAG: alkaline phosphatase family protein [Xenophilus sp.]